VQHVIDAKRYGELHIPAAAIPMIERSWNEEPPSLYGRFDLAYDGDGPPKMLEYNADTPTTLLEASVIQWDWMQAQHHGADQFNSIHERLVALWREFQPYLPKSNDPRGHIVHFASTDSAEDGMTAAYIADTAAQAGMRTNLLPINEIGWNPGGREFRDSDEQKIDTLFKLYPWEWLMSEPFAEHIRPSGIMVIEPAWKMVLSNKGILPILWELFPENPYLLPAYFGDPMSMMEWVRKPLLSREGANVTVHSLSDHIEGHGEYGVEGFVFQQLADIPEFDGQHPILGSWIIGQEASGMGIRESAGAVTDNSARFVPHIMAD
jgi:glutathionylspermidine synthase